MAQPPPSGSTLKTLMSTDDSSSKGDGYQRGAMDGYDYEFVPAADERYKCAICLLVLREPQQTPCGHRYCRNCIVKWLRAPHSTCPVDNKVITERDLFPDNFAKREIENFQVFCPNSKHGCDVISTVKNISDHLNGCPFSEVPCANSGCPNLLLRRDLEEHVTTSCEHRSVVCTYCGSSFTAKELKCHFQSCPEVRVKCEYCEEEISRRSIPEHEEETCPKKVVFCSYHTLGCQVQTERGKMDGHHQESIVAHMSMLCQAVIQIFQFLGIPPPTAGMEQLQAQEGIQPSEILGMMARMLSSLQQVPAQARMAQQSSLGPQSPFASMARGSLTPPLLPSLPPSSLPTHPPPASTSPSPSPSASATPAPPPSHAPSLAQEVQEASFLQYGSHGSTGGRKANMSPNSSVLSVGGPESWSKSTSVSWQEEQQLILHTQKLVELQAQVEQMDRYKQKMRQQEQRLADLQERMCQGKYFWKIQHFSKVQQDSKRGESSALHSEPFYTSPTGGYKVCMRANLYGSDTSCGRHLSLFIHFMQGEYDDVLDWPFSGRIVLSVLDQNDCTEARCHVTETLSARPSLAAFQRPTTNRNHKGFGYLEFMPLDALERSSYIKNDTLIVMVHVLPNNTSGRPF